MSATTSATGIMSWAVPFTSGLAFGFALDRGRVSVPFTIANQMSFQNFTMMRMFLAASAVSTACILIMHMLGIAKRKVRSSVNLGFIDNIFGGNIVGGLLLGSGMALAGACPGTVWPQLAAFRSFQQFAVIAGGIAGTIVFGYLHRPMQDMFPKFHSQTPAPLHQQHTLLNIASVAIIFGCVGAIYGVDYVFPWQEQLGQVVASKPGESDWDPMLAGAVVGLLQIPAQLSIGSSFGQSSGWVYVSDRVASVFDSKLEKHAPYLRKARYSSGAYWQFMASIGAIVGALISQEIEPMQLSQQATIAFSAQRAFAGGFLLLFGARLGMGCTSGHGLSGVASASIGSMISVACMFIGGGITSLLVN